MIYHVYLQVKRGGRTHAHVPDWPGCNWVADSPTEAWNRSTEMLARHFTWLRKYQQPAPPVSEPIQPWLAQQHKSTAREGNLIGFFECERHPVAAAEIPAFLNLMGCARSELLEITQVLPDEVLYWSPGSDSWSVEETLRHVAGAERWYLTRILGSDGLPVFKPQKSVWSRLEMVRALALERLMGLGEPELCAVVTDEAGELWSARKVFRRYVEHEREHTCHIEGILEQYRQSIL